MILWVNDNTGVVKDPMAPSSFGAWLSHAGTHHVGAISFLLADFFLFFGVAVLTVVQASQVCFCTYSPHTQKCIFFFFLHLVNAAKSSYFYSARCL